MRQLSLFLVLLFWKPGTNIDLKFISRSNLFKTILSEVYDITVPGGYHISENGVKNNLLFLFGDVSYHYSPILANPMEKSQIGFEKKFSFRQEYVRENVERLFDILRSKYDIVRREIRRWDFNETVRISN